MRQSRTKKPQWHRAFIHQERRLKEFTSLFIKNWRIFPLCSSFENKEKGTGRIAAYIPIFLFINDWKMVYVKFKLAAQSSGQKRPSAATLEHHSVPPENLVAH
jgi:hypothetical protein